MQSVARYLCDSWAPCDGFYAAVCKTNDSALGCSVGIGNLLIANSSQPRSSFAHHVMSPINIAYCDRFVCIEMKVLDGDSIRLKDAKGRKAERDIVQVHGD